MNHKTASAVFLCAPLALGLSACDDEESVWNLREISGIVASVNNPKSVGSDSYMEFQFESQTVTYRCYIEREHECWLIEPGMKMKVEVANTAGHSDVVQKILDLQLYG